MADAGKDSTGSGGRKLTQHDKKRHEIAENAAKRRAAALDAAAAKYDRDKGCETPRMGMEGDAEDLRIEGQDHAHEIRKLIRAGHLDHPAVQEWAGAQRALGESGEQRRMLKNVREGRLNTLLDGGKMSSLADLWLRMHVPTLSPGEAPAIKPLVQKLRADLESADWDDGLDRIKKIEAAKLREDLRRRLAASP